MIEGYYQEGENENMAVSAKCEGAADSPTREVLKERAPRPETFKDHCNESGCPGRFR